MNTETRVITGNITADPQLRQTSDGTPVTDLRIAVTARAKTTEGEWIDAGTEYYTVTAWRREAENVAQCLRKGNRVTVTGTVYRDAYTDSDGAVHVTTRIKPTSPIAAALDYQSVTITKNTRRPAAEQ